MAITDAQTEATLLEQVDLPGRKAELKQFIKALALCRTGQGRAVYLTGNEGIGKTALLKAFLDLSEVAYGCKTVLVPPSAKANTHWLFVSTVQAILKMAQTIIDDTVLRARDIVQPLGLSWGQSDLMHIVAMMRLQESLSSQQSVAIEQLTQSIYAAVPFFKRWDGSIKLQIQDLAQIISDPWVTLGVSLLNPINPQVQKVLAYVERIAGEGQVPMMRPAMSLLPGATLEPAATADAVLLPPDLASQEKPESSDLVDEGADSGLPTLAELQTVLSDLLTFMNNGLKSHQAVFVLAFDQWESILSATEPDRAAMKEFLAEVCRRTVDQRGYYLMVVVSGRSEVESYTVGGNLFNMLKVKYLLPSLPTQIQQKWLKEQLANDPVLQAIPWDDAVIQDVFRLCKGNPAWLKLMLSTIATELQSSGPTVLDWDVYQERFAINRPEDLLELLWTKLQLEFVGEEDLFLKSIAKMTAQYGYGAFTLAQLRSILPKEARENGLSDKLVNVLSTYGILQAQGKSSPGETTYQFDTPFLLGYLQEKSRPLQEDMPTPDKVASLKKILPLSIQSGELTKEKTQELLAMASALENPELVQFVENTLVHALQTAEVSTGIKTALLESLSLLSTVQSVQAIIKALQDPDALVREVACLQLLPFANRLASPVSPQALLNAVLPLTEDPATAVQYQAYQLIATSSADHEQVVPLLLSGIDHTDAHIRMLAFSGLVHRRVTTPQVFERYMAFLKQDTIEPTLFKVALKGLMLFDKDQVVAALVRYLEEHRQSAEWAEALLTLMNLDLKQALAWIKTFIHQSTDTDLKLYLLKRLGSKPNPDVEKILTQVLVTSGGAAQSDLPLEVRWMAIRSLGWIGQTRDAYQTLEVQRTYCEQDAILVQALQSALRQVSERLSVSTPEEEPSGTTPAAPVASGYAARNYAPLLSASSRKPAASAENNEAEPVADENAHGGSDNLIDLVLISSDN